MKWRRMLFQCLSLSIVLKRMSAMRTWLGLDQRPVDRVTPPRSRTFSRGKMTSWKSENHELKVREKAWHLALWNHQWTNQRWSEWVWRDRLRLETDFIHELRRKLFRGPCWSARSRILKSGKKKRCIIPEWIRTGNQIDRGTLAPLRISKHRETQFREELLGTHRGSTICLLNKSRQESTFPYV